MARLSARNLTLVATPLVVLVVLAVVEAVVVF